MAADQTPYPGNVNQPDRKDPAWEQYHTFEQRVNHELPDMRHDWQNDTRDDIGFGVSEPWGKQPTVASIRVAANKSVRIATLLLGEKVADSVIQAQALDFMAMSHTALDQTLQRFAETQKLYADEEEKKEEVEDKKAADEKVEDKQEEKEVKADAAAPFTPAIDKPGAEVEVNAADEKKDEKVEEKKDEKVASADLQTLIASAVSKAIQAALPDFIQKKIDEKKEKDEAKKAADETDKKDEKKEEVKKAADEVKKDEKKDEKACTATDESVKKDEKVEEKKEVEAHRSATEMDIELTGAMDDELAPDSDADERLASLFSDDGIPAVATAETSIHKIEASQKMGIKKLGGQPRVASAMCAGGQDLGNLWKSAPDVNDVFK